LIEGGIIYQEERDRFRRIRRLWEESGGIRSLIAQPIIAIKNWSVEGNIPLESARSAPLVQAAHLRGFMRQFQRSISGHHGVVC
jgi:hypothetical protein